MKFSTQQFIVTGLSVIACATLAAPATQAAELKGELTSSAQQLRLAGLDSRNKSFDVKEGFSVQKLRLEGLDSRNKVGDSLKTTSLIEQRHQVLERGSK